MTSPEEPNELKLAFRFDAVGEVVTVTVSDWHDPMVALAALKTAGSEESLNDILEQMREQAEQ